MLLLNSIQRIKRMAFIKMFAIFVLIFFVIVSLVKKNTPPVKFHSEDAYATSNYINVKNSEFRLQKNEITQKMNSLKKPDYNFLDFYETEKVYGELVIGIYNAIENHYGLPENLLFNQLMKESRGLCPMYKNRAGAVGCFQFLDHTASEFGLLNGKFDFRGNLYASAEGSARYLVWLTFLIFGNDADPGNWEQLRYSLAAFNAGHSNVKKYGKVRMPNFYETIEYVHDIESLVKKESEWVYPGDTINKIAKRVRIEPDVILKANPSIIDNRSLKAHTVISLPNPETGLSKLLIKKGMTLYRIQETTGVDVSFIKEANFMGDENTLYAGAVLNIPTR
jgi:LysM repeat protein